jgi:RecJ-like exonuclease
LPPSFPPALPPEEQSQYVTCPLCGGVGTIESGDGRYVCPFCGGTGVVTKAKAATYNPADWYPCIIKVFGYRAWRALF